MSFDPTSKAGRWHSLHRLIAAMDAQIADVYQRHHATEMRPRFAYPMLRLAHSGPMTVNELAVSLDRSHSAMSQTVKAMRKLNLVTSTAGPDARTRRIALSDRGKELLPLVDAEWRATESAIAELDDEVPYALSRVVQDLNHSLQKEALNLRVIRHLGDIENRGRP